MTNIAYAAIFAGIGVAGVFIFQLWLLSQIMTAIATLKPLIKDYEDSEEQP